MKRLAVVLVVVAGAIVDLYVSGYIWPVATTIVRPLLPRDGPTSEPEVIA